VKLLRRFAVPIALALAMLPAALLVPPSPRAALAQGVPVTKVFIIAGQSNGMGYGNRGYLYPTPSWMGGISTPSSDTGTFYDHPTPTNFPCLWWNYNGNTPYDGWGRFEGERQNSAGVYAEEGSFGPELAFLWKYHLAHPADKIAVYKYAVGGTSMLEWSPPNGSMWTGFSTWLDKAKARLDAAAANGAPYEWAGMLWMHGESGASTVYPYLYPTAGQEYSDQCRAFFAAVRNRTSQALPIVLGRIGNHMLADAVIGTTNSGMNTPENRRGATNYRRAQQQIVGSDAGNAWIDTDNLPVLQSGDPAYWYHHTTAGYLAMGERFWAGYVNLTGTSAPPPPPPALTTIVKFSGVEQPDKTAAVKLNGAAVGNPGDTIEIDVTPR
jgi:hypothetical protein